MIRQCDREHEKITADSALYNIMDNGDQIENGLRNSKIETIYFTSRFGKNNAAKLFVDRFKIKYKRTWNPETNEFLIDEHVFGRPIRAVVLFSPSGQANIGISKTPAYLANIDYYQQFPKPVSRFKLEFYQKKFHFLG